MVNNDYETPKNHPKPMEKPKKEESLLKSPVKGKHHDKNLDQVEEPSEFELKASTSPLKQ